MFVYTFKQFHLGSIRCLRAFVLIRLKVFPGVGAVGRTVKQVNQDSEHGRWAGRLVTASIKVFGFKRVS